jgi:hypothetical protein
MKKYLIKSIGKNRADFPPEGTDPSCKMTKLGSGNQSHKHDRVSNAQSQLPSLGYKNRTGRQSNPASLAFALGV